MAGKVSLETALANVKGSQIGARCMTCAMMDEMTEDDVRVFNEAASSSVSTPTLVKALAAAGYTTSRGSLARHRRGECVTR